jgi:hypothetical protein
VQTHTGRYTCKSSSAVAHVHRQRYKCKPSGWPGGLVQLEIKDGCCIICLVVCSVMSDEHRVAFKHTLMHVHTHAHAHTQLYMQKGMKQATGACLKAMSMGPPWLP